MNDRYIAFDVETPNYANDRISAIGITVIQGGTIQEEFYSLVNPEAPFQQFHMALTGIRPELVAGQPSFPALWPVICPLLESGLLAAHNAPFDMSVLAKCLAGYGIRWRPYVRYICTCRMGRRLLPQLPNHKLDTMCSCLGLELNHHHAGSDSRACGELLLHYLRSGAEIPPFVSTYDMLRIRTVPRPRQGKAPR